MRRQEGGIIPPSPDQLKSIAEKYHFTLDDEQAHFFKGLIEGSLASYRRVAELPEPTLSVKYPRTPGYRPDSTENPYNAWYYKTAVKGSLSGKLQGKRIAIKDPISLAGVPTMAGSALMEGFTPSIDATVVTRILDAGGEIAGKSTCEDMCISGGSITSISGPVKNPINPEYGSGGSSSGSAVLVAANDVDMAIGADQGGSIRLPSSQCGIVGLKPTYGLVPYTGIFPIENSLDHVGPMAKTVEDTALLLEVIAGKDHDYDPRQTHSLEKGDYLSSLTDEIRDLKIGIVKEGFGLASLLDDRNLQDEGQLADSIVRDAAFNLERSGASVTEVSIPLHSDGAAIYTPIFIEGIAKQMIEGNGLGIGYKGFYHTAAMNYYARARKTEGENYSDLCKLVTLMGEYMYENYQGRYYAKAQNQILSLRSAYDKALSTVDALIVPTCAPVSKAMKLTLPITPDSYIKETFNYHMNCCPQDATGHPALTVPCGKIDGLPIGMMIIGKHFDEAKILRIGHAFEKLGIYQQY